MKQTLLVIPHEWLGWPLQLAWWLLLLALGGWAARREGWGKAAGQFVPLGLGVSLLLYLVVPFLEVSGINFADPLGPPVPLGLAIRGYGVCLTLAIAAAVGLVIWRATQLQLNVDRLLSLCFWMVVVGIVGARIFYVVQKWDQFQFVDVRQFLLTLADMTKGGLVVYGSLFGAALVLAFSERIWKLPVRLVLDVVAPAMLLGLAIGRIGCLLNGCCYGGECRPEYPLAIRFPVEAPAYLDQLHQGRLLGLRGDWNSDASFPLQVTEVEVGGLVAELGLPIEVGQRLRILTPGSDFLAASKAGKIDLPLRVTIEREGVPGALEVPVDKLPARTLPMHPAQVYATTSAFLVAAVLWLAFPWRRFDGQLFVWMLVFYPLSRLLEEVIRSDELGIWGTPLTISQWISVGLLAAGVGLWLVLRSRPVLTWRVSV
ncbi:MAG: prolipoprotein diacylglyceryl transferase [Planctomycetota bacterium]|jgi:phosphatidylglycerol:prolipoprotein diacylglycerol transferase